MEAAAAVTLVDSTERRVSEAFESWLASLPWNTAAAYRQSWAALMQFSARTPIELRRADLAKWIERMRGDGKSGATINLRLAAISSFFNYLRDCYGIVLDNPAQGKVLRQKTHRWEGSRFLDADSARAFLGAIDRTTAKGARDYALFTAYLFTGRRNSEIRRLRWGDIEESGGQVFYRWSGKGKSRKDQMPTQVINAIIDYLTISGRIESIQPKDYIFISTVRAQTSQPICAHQVRRLLNSYLQSAGFITHYRVHDLRHTAAMLYKAAGEDIESIQMLLNHSNVNTTSIYLHALEGHADKAWGAVGDLLGMAGEASRFHGSRIARGDPEFHSAGNLELKGKQRVTIREESLCHQLRENGRTRQPLPGIAALSAQ